MCPSIRVLVQFFWTAEQQQLQVGNCICCHFFQERQEDNWYQPVRRNDNWPARRPVDMRFERLLLRAI